MKELIEGLTALDPKGSHQGRMAGSKFVLPPNFDANKFASKWEEKGPAVIEAAQEQILESANCKADGWQVYKDISNKNAPYERVIGKKTFVLLFRPRLLQKAVNAIYADESRRLVNLEVAGETNAVNVAGDPGILTNADLRRFGKHLEPDEGASYLPPNAGGQPTRLQEAATIELQ